MPRITPASFARGAAALMRSTAASTSASLTRSFASSKSPLLKKASRMTRAPRSWAASMLCSIQAGRAGIAGQRIRVEQAHHERTDGQASLLHLLLVTCADLGIGDGEPLGGIPHANLNTFQSSLAGLVQVNHAGTDADLRFRGGDRCRLDLRQQRGSGERRRGVREESSSRDVHVVPFSRCKYSRKCRTSAICAVVRGVGNHRNSSPDSHTAESPCSGSEELSRDEPSADRRTSSDRCGSTCGSIRQSAVPCSSISAFSYE